MVVFAMMIGLITESIGEMLEEVKRGKSPTAESDHTLILGWSEKGIVILRQLALANQSAGGKSIVVLCDRSKEEMEEMLQTAESKKNDPLQMHGSQVVFRRGNTLAENDLVNRPGPPLFSPPALARPSRVR
jgi:ion channel POLLUX/CASTOR